MAKEDLTGFFSAVSFTLSNGTNVSLNQTSAAACGLMVAANQPIDIVLDVATGTSITVHAKIKSKINA